ncbi:putative kilA anti-repressor protein [Escherichia phage Ioannina]|nr:putative kilA anti-repressor protein [Escherichia phage Ioannina]
MIEEKRCSQCGCVKPLSQFHKYTGKTARSPDGYRAQCKSCRNKAERERQRRYREERE